jgi:hypothetical protein
MAKKRITIQLIGASADQQDVRLSDFIEQLKSIKKALHETELALSGADDPALDYKVVGLRHSSPSEVDLEPVGLGEKQPQPEYVSRVITHFTTELRLIKSKGRLLTDPDLQRLHAYQEIGRKPDNRIESVKIKFGRTIVTIDDKFKEKLDKIVGPDELAQGTISGMLEAVNFHNTNRFTLYPPLGPKKVSGTFASALRPKVKEAIGGFVTVRGLLRYKAWGAYPHGIIAEEIDIHEPESELPTLSDLRGAFVGSLGEMNSAEFIDQLRDEDW